MEGYLPWAIPILIVRHSSTCAAIVLHAYDVGEADRLCVLLTQTHGKIVARVPGARQCKSRMGGATLPLHCVFVTLHAARSGWYMCEARLVHACNTKQPILLQQGVEILMLLLQDGEPAPDIFALTEEFFDMCPTTLVPFTMKLLHIMGVLPVNDEDERFRKLSSYGQDFVRHCTRYESLKSLEERFPCGDQSLLRFCDAILREQLPRPLHSMAIASVMRSI